VIAIANGECQCPVAGANEFLFGDNRVFHEPAMRPANPAESRRFESIVDMYGDFAPTKNKKYSEQND
jgi:hypothetical protein